MTWADRHPWVHSGINASIFTGIMTWGRSADDAGGVWLPAGSWLVLFVVGALITKHLGRNATDTAATDLILRGSPADTGEDGRRWRTGAP